jgi:peptidoglycan hydrolase-like protein with peptidoglycan-binding domain
LNLSEQDRKRVQVALNSLGHPIPTVTGYFGSRTRAMIAAWQKAQGLPDTGYLTEAQLTSLWQQAAPALSKDDEVQGKPKQN